ncbi:putative dehydrogenase [Leifsonia sp. EB41]|uniref:Gfo/Idh/MocA family protein n=1 Tax=Leifsonia sp. EB41 TaxID=3156260 RepID=UPI00351382A1
MTRSGPVGVGIVGAGMVSDQYLDQLSRYPDLAVLSIRSRNSGRAAAQAEKYGIPSSGDIDSVLANDDVELVLNLTTPAAHVEVSTAALMAGKHVWSEKPIGIERDSARTLVELAEERDLLLGVAPDTLLGPLWQTAGRAIQAGVIGKPLSATTQFQSQGPDWFHPDPAFLFATGAGPLFDNGPYYLSALVSILGPIREVAAVGSRAQETRSVHLGPLAGTTFRVEVPTHVAATMLFDGGEMATSLMSVDTPRFAHGIFEVTGTEGTMVIGDPVYYSAEPIRVYRRWTSFPTTFEQDFETIPERGAPAGRGVGAVTMARTLRGHDLHVATGRLGYHVLDALAATEESIARHEFVKIESTVERVPLLPADFDPYKATI